jgi:RimJ/RimL family protein N-acetyltransferase
MPSSPSRNLELLRLQAGASLDHHGRIIGCYGVTIAHCDDGQVLWIGTEVPDAMASELTAAFDRASPTSYPAEPRSALDVCAAILASADGAIQRTAGPSYLIPPDTQFASDVTIERSDGSNVERLRAGNPGNWHPVEWEELLGGRFGPWAIATAGDHVVSICHTPGPLTERSAECGVWTAPAFRGRGYAAAVTSAWVALARSPQRKLFYSTDADNLSSQRVAQRLHLRNFGWTWRLRRATAEPDLRVHPLCSLYQGAKA